MPRETLRQSLLLSCGIADFDTEILLSVTDDEDLKDIRPLIWDQLDMYITQQRGFRVDLDCMGWRELIFHPHVIILILSFIMI